MTKQPALGRGLDDLTSLAAFVQVVESRSFTAAARTAARTRLRPMAAAVAAVAEP